MSETKKTSDRNVASPNAIYINVRATYTNQERTMRQFTTPFNVDMDYLIKDYPLQQDLSAEITAGRVLATYAGVALSPADVLGTGIMTGPLGVAWKKLGIDWWSWPSPVPKTGNNTTYFGFWWSWGHGFDNQRSFGRQNLL
jgi:hypothetical protein